MLNLCLTRHHPHQRAVPILERVWLAFLYLANLSTGYLLMLAVMTFNTGYVPLPIRCTLMQQQAS